MKSLCIQCARFSTVRSNVATRQAQRGLRTFSTAHRFAADDNKNEAGPAVSDLSLPDALKAGAPKKPPPRRPIIRKYQVGSMDRTDGAQSIDSRAARSSDSPSSPIRQVLQRAPPKDGPQVLRRTQSPDRPLPQRTGGPQATQPDGRPRRPNTDARRNSLGQRGKPGQSAGPRGKGPGAKGPDRRRRLAPKEQEEDNSEIDRAENFITEQLERNIDRPANPTTFLPYDPQKLTLEDLRADWPNTPLSTAGMTESVVQKIEWLSRRLPHGYQTPQEIAEHYLKGNFTRFESDAERESILKLASELSAKTKSDGEAGLLHKHKTPRFPDVADPAFTSLAAKSMEKSFLVDTSVKGEYIDTKQPELPFLQNAARILNNNETYGPIQTQRFLNRLEALMPQARAAGGKAKTKTKRA